MWPTYCMLHACTSFLRVTFASMQAAAVGTATHACTYDINRSASDGTVLSAQVVQECKGYCLSPLAQPGVGLCNVFLCLLGRVWPQAASQLLTCSSLHRAQYVLVKVLSAKHPCCMCDAALDTCNDIIILTSVYGRQA